MTIDEYPLTLDYAITNGKALAATDASMDGTLMATYWIVAPFEHQIKIEGGTQSTKCENGMTLEGEGLGVLSLVTQLKTKLMI